MAPPSRPPYVMLLALAVLLGFASGRPLAAEEPAGASDAGADQPPAPLVHQWRREGYNLWTEIKACLDQEAYADIALLIRNAPPQVDRGLLVDFAEPDLLVSYPTLISLVSGDYPQVRLAMQERFGQLAQLRLGVATAEGDRTGVEAVAEGFPGTEAAAAARGWLGDRDMAAGRFDDALRQFQQGLHGTTSTMRTELAARARLAGAMMGRQIGEPVEGTVRFGQSQLTAAKFEKLVAERLAFSREWPAARPVGGLDNQPAVVPMPGEFQLRRLPDFGLRSIAVSSAKSRSQLDWQSLALSVVQHEGLLIATDGHCAGALDASSGQKRWLQDFGRDFPYTHGPPPPIRPLVAGPSLYLRHRGKASLTLHCLDLELGRIVWTSDTDRYVVSDPLVCSDRLLALTFVPQPLPGAKKTPSRSRVKGKTMAVDPAAWQLRLTTFDPEQGDVTADRSLVDVLEFSRGVPPCRAAAGDDRIVAAVPGAVVCTDLSGRVPWVRRQPWSEEATLDDLPAPKVAGGRVFVAQPSGEQVECLDLDTGRKLWMCPVPKLQRVVGIAGARLVVACEGGLAAIETGTGRLAWRTELAEPVSTVLCGEPGGVVYARYDQSDARTWALVLVWLDVATGKMVSEHAVLDDIGLPRHTGPKSPPGPLVSTSGRLMAGFRVLGSYEKISELVELTPAAAADAGSSPTPPSSTPTDHHGD